MPLAVIKEPSGRTVSVEVTTAHRILVLERPACPTPIQDMAAKLNVMQAF
jgi:hypothetical protein